MKTIPPLLICPLLWLAATTAAAQSGRDYITVVGSSTVYPFTTTVAEQFGKTGKFKTPKVESTGTGGGIKLFCAGVGVGHPDIVDASRAITAGEIESCNKAGVREVIEVKIGYDGIVVAGSNKSPVMKLSRRDLFLALARQVPDPANPQKLIANPYKTWNQVNPELPAEKIEVLGPPPTSGTRDAFTELVMENGCTNFPVIKALQGSDEPNFKRVCDSLREDGAYIEAGENDNLIVQKLQASPKILGIFGYSFMEENLSVIHGSPIEGVVPTFDSIASGQYVVSRPLFIYVKGAHMDVIPGMRQFLAEYVSQRSMGEEGYLADKGLIPMPAAEVTAVRASLQSKLEKK
ncbi:MAG: substrate-binding domain-containing protein [Nevskiaceae bacterium]|jgi:phosphate transport system substrate-binding protein|nr:substrate-binding domain-containing protein [Nevskiaceae bacterium]